MGSGAGAMWIGDRWFNLAKPTRRNGPGRSCPCLHNPPYPRCRRDLIYDLGVVNLSSVNVDVGSLNVSSLDCGLDVDCLVAEFSQPESTRHE
jgi:hypothetical protein